MARGDYGWKSRAKRFAELLNSENKVESATVDLPTNLATTDDIPTDTVTSTQLSSVQSTADSALTKANAAYSPSNPPPTPVVSGTLGPVQWGAWVRIQNTYSSNLDRNLINAAVYTSLSGYLRHYGSSSNDQQNQAYNPAGEDVILMGEENYTQWVLTAGDAGYIRKYRRYKYRSFS